VSVGPTRLGPIAKLSRPGGLARCRGSDNGQNMLSGRRAIPLSIAMRPLDLGYATEKQLNHGANTYQVREKLLIMMEAVP